VPNTPKPNLSLYLPYYAKECSEFAVPISTSLRKDKTTTCVDVKAVANFLQSCVRYAGLWDSQTLDLPHTRSNHLNVGF